MAPREWDGEERRTDADWLQHKKMVLKDISDIKDDVKTITKDIVEFRISMAELKLEIKSLVGKSAATTSTIVSFIISATSGIALIFFQGK